MFSQSTLSVPDAQFQSLAAKARLHGCLRGYLHKAADSKLKRLSQKWCCIYQNLFFQFESASVAKPLGVIFLEGTSCKPLEQSDCPTNIDVESAFCITAYQNRQHFFVALSNKEREEWLQAINDANMGRLAHERDSLKLMRANLESALNSSVAEVQRLKEANSEARSDITHLRAEALQSPKSPVRWCRQSPVSRRSKPDYVYYSSHRVIKVHVRKEEEEGKNAAKLQRFIRSWLIHKKWRDVLKRYLESPSAEMMRTRNKLIWKLVASEENYVDQLKVLNEDYCLQCEMAAAARRPLLTVEQCKAIFRNCNELLVFHQLFLKGLHLRVEKWPLLAIGEVLKTFVPMLPTVYQQYESQESQAIEMLADLMSEPSFMPFIEGIHSRVICASLSLEELLQVPLNRTSCYLQELQELLAHTPFEHVDYPILKDVIANLEMIQKTMSDEPSTLDVVQRVLAVENRIEDGCEALLDKEQVLIREGSLDVVMNSESPKKLKMHSKYFFLFSKHLLITTKFKKNSQNAYRLSKDIGPIPVVSCRIMECKFKEVPELNYLGIRVQYEAKDGLMDDIILSAHSIADKAQWFADLSQCVENAKQNRILQSKSLGQPVELSTTFIRYSSFKSGKEQLVNCGTLESLMQRLLTINHYGMDFVNTFLMTFPLFTNSRAVMEFLYKKLTELFKQTRVRSVLTPEDFILQAKASSKSLSLPIRSKSSLQDKPQRYNASNGGSGSWTPINAEAANVLSAIFFALRQWVCKHFYHFRTNADLAADMERVIEATKTQDLPAKNKRSVEELKNLYQMQKLPQPVDPILALLKPREPSQKEPFSEMLFLDPKVISEQLCLIESKLFSRIETGEILRHFTSKKDQKSVVAPNVANGLNHFNRMSLFFLWSVAMQPISAQRTKALEFLITVATECLRQHNFSSVMQLSSVLNHSALRKFRGEWAGVSKHLRQQLETLTKITSTQKKFRRLRDETERAQPPLVPYLGVCMSEVATILEARPNFVNNDMVNFMKMRQLTHSITNILQYQQGLYEFSYVEEICRMLLCTPLPGSEDELYDFVEGLMEHLDDTLCISSPS